MITPTTKQALALATIAEFYDREGRTPTYRELMEEMGARSTSRLHATVKLLEERGWVTTGRHGITAFIPLPDPRPVPTTTFITDAGRIIKAPTVALALTLAAGPVWRAFKMTDAPPSVRAKG